MASKKIVADLWVRRITELVTLCPALGAGPLGLIREGALAVADGLIVWVGPDDQLTSHCRLAPDGDEIDGRGAVLTPGLIDCHTHLIFAGSREGEFELRSQGATYQEIAAAGGGIVSTMGATREASFDDLLDLTLRRLTAALERGVTTVEVKSGYGLSLEAEIKILKVAQVADMTHPVDLVPTFLGAHSLPPERRGDRLAYVDEVVEHMLPRVAAEGLARYCDVFCERGAFTVEETRRIGERAKALGLGVRLHAEQLSRSGGAQLAAELGAASADHLEYASDEDLAAMAAAGTVAVLLPGAALFLGQELPNARRFLDAGVVVALATDYNPGSSPTQNLALMGTLAITRMGMSPAEALTAMTLSAARSVDLEASHGSIEVGKVADLALFAASDYRALFYRFGEIPCAAVVKDGRPVYP